MGNKQMIKQLLNVENLILEFQSPTGPVRAIDDISLSLNKGETLALVGESGCGKTALCRAIMGLHSSHAKILQGKIEIESENVVGLEEGYMRKIRGKKVSMIFQDPMSSLDPTFTVGQQIMEPIILHNKIRKSEAKDKALKLLEKVGIENCAERFDQYPHHFSGGMRQRVAIAIALACNPDLIIADEPTTALDKMNRDTIIDILKNISQIDNKTIIFVTHDLELVKNFAQRVIIMKQGKIVEEGVTEKVFQEPKHPYTKELIHYSNYGKHNSHFHGNINSDKAICNPLINIHDLCKEYPISKRNYIRVIDHLNLTVNKGEVLGLIGESGCGKSTLARIIMGIEKATNGEIEIARGTKCQMIFQDSTSAFNPGMKISEIIGEPLKISGNYTKTDIDRKIKEVMMQVGLEESVGERKPYNVSGGQRQRAAIARALITKPDVIIADEPISSLDVSVQAQIVHLLKKLRDDNDLTIVLIAHDLPMVQHVSDRVIEMT